MEKNDQTNLLNEINYTNIILIDINIKGYDTIVSSCNINTLPIGYSYTTKRIDISYQIYEQLKNQSQKINRIAICSDSTTLTFLEDQPFFNCISNENVDFIVELIKDYDISYIDYLACNTLNYPQWNNYYQLLMSLTNVIVGASNNPTGNLQYGGDWILENTSENIEKIYFTENIKYYQYLLGNYFYKNTTDIISNFSSITQLTSFPTFNGISNFSTKYHINNSGVYVDLALLYALNSSPITASYNTSMYTYVGGTKYDLSSLFAPVPISSVLFNYLDTTKITFAVSVRLLIKQYTGPIMKIRNSSTNATQDFYSDLSQNYLTTSPNNTGVSYATWIGANTGYVVTLYDQSGKNNDAKNLANDTTQPTLTLISGKYIIYFITANLTFLTITPCQPITLFCSFYPNLTTSGIRNTLISACKSDNSNGDYSLRFNNNTTLAISTTPGNANDWLYSGTGSKNVMLNNVFKTTGTTNITINVWNHLAIYNQLPSWSYTTFTGVKFNTIGYIPIQPTRGLTGYMTEMICHDTIMNSTDMSDFYNNRLI